MTTHPRRPGFVPALPAPTAPAASPARRAALVVGAVVAMGLGAWFALHPLASLRVALPLALLLAALRFFTHRRNAPGGPGVGWIAAAGFAVCAVLVLGWPGVGYPTALGLGAVWLLCRGLACLVRATGSTGRDRISAALGSISRLAGSGSVLLWPDLALLCLAYLLGLGMIWWGARLCWRTLATSHRSASPLARRAPRTSRNVQAFRLMGSGLAALAAAGWVLGSLAVVRAEPRPDDFYTAPEQVPTAPGELVRSEPFDRDIPSGSSAWRILYTTTRDDGVPALASGLVVVPDAATAAPVIGWAHGTTGVARGCAPTLIHPFEDGAFHSIERLLAQGWAYVGTDYTGLGTQGPHPYLIGQGEGRSVLDALRAARQLERGGLGERNVLWGHSQGGHAALWAAHLAPTYAPDLDLTAVATLAPATDLPALVEQLGNTAGGAVFGSFVMEAYARTYPEVTYRDTIAPPAEPIVRSMAGRCLAAPSTLASVVSAVVLGGSVWRDDPAGGALGERLAENVPPAGIRAPLLIGQGTTDSLVVPQMQDGYVERMCAAGQRLDYRTYPGREHLSLVEAESPAIDDLFTWTSQRLSGAAARSTC